MRPAVVLLVFCLLLALGAVGLLLFTGTRGSGPESTDRRAALALPERASAAPAESEARSTEVFQRLDSLARELEQVRAEVASLKAGAAREPAPEVAAANPVDDAPAAFASEHRSAILRVIEEDRETQRRKQEEEQRARDLQASLARAERTAKQLGLAPDQQKALADVYVLERQKVEELRSQMRDQGGPGGDPEAIRTTFREMRDWRMNELTTRFGSDLADKINEADMGGFRGNGPWARRGNRGPGGTGGADGGPDGGNRSGGGF